jgi:hypothetical protein
MKQRTVLALVGLAFLSGSAAHAGHPKPQLKSAPIATLSRQDKRHLLHDTFAVVRTVWEIPKPVQKQLFHDGKDGLNGMVDPGQEYQATDVIDKILPYRRLIFAAISQGYCLVYYESGGWQSVDLFRFSSGQAKRTWAGNLVWAHYRPLTLTELRTQIKIGQYHSVRGGEWFPPLP